MGAVSKIARIPIWVLQESTAQALHRRRLHAEQARYDLRLTISQRSLRQRKQALRYLPLALARRLVPMHRTTPRFGTVVRSLSTLWAFARSLILDAFAVATSPQRKLRHLARYFARTI